MIKPRIVSTIGLIVVLYFMYGFTAFTRDLQALHFYDQGIIYIQVRYHSHFLHSFTTNLLIFNNTV